MSHGRRGTPVFVIALRTCRAVIEGRLSTVGVPLVVGAVLGMVSVSSDYLLRQPWSAVGNLAGTWVLAAFAVGARSRQPSITRGAGSGLLSLVTAAIVYYLLTALLWPPEAIGRLVFGVIVWVLVAVAAGPVAGAAGASWRGASWPRSAQAWSRPVSVAAVAAMLFAEAMFLGLGTADADWPSLVAELAIAAALPVVLLRSLSEIAVAYGAIAVLAFVGLPLTAILMPIVFKLAGAGW